MADQTQSQAPRVLTDDNSRQMARQIRDDHWSIMEKVGHLGTLWCCWWDKAGRFSKRDFKTGIRIDTAPENVQVFGLIGATEFLEWTKRHSNWWVIGEWSDERYAAPVSLTAAGRAALAQRYLYDMEPVTGGMVDPGWQATPAEAIHG